MKGFNCLAGGALGRLLMKHGRKSGAAALLALAPWGARADELSAGDTAWMLTATALVLFMTIPGLSLFYAGMVRSKNVLSVMMQCFAITSLMTVLWVAFGYSLAFTGDGAYWGSLEQAFLRGLTVDSLSGTIPESVFMTFQMTFAIITPALIVGAFAERMKFSAVLWFMAAWLALVYAPVCHWVWGGGWLGDKGILDFAGGTVVHINAGMAGLVAALVVGKRKGYPRSPMMPHNVTYTLIGASMLWVGWFGFNAGSELAADGVAGMALAVTQIATASAALAWMFSEWLSHGKPSALGIATGAVAGLVAITPASGSVGPLGAVAVGLAAGVGCFFRRGQTQAHVRLRRFVGCVWRSRRRRHHRRLVDGGVLRGIPGRRRVRRGSGRHGRATAGAVYRRLRHCDLRRPREFHYPEGCGPVPGLAGV